MKTIIIFATFLVILTGFIFISSNSVIGEEVRPSNQKNPPLVSREDSVITTDVKNKITDDEKLRGLILNVKAHNGIVTLSGTVHSQDELNRAIELAKNTPGVVSVEQKITIDPATVSDTKTPTAEQRAVIVEKGQKELDEAADMSGDTNIANEIKVKFAADDLIKSRNIRITSTDGVVTLKGTVRSAAEQEQAIRLANSVPGVKEVKSELIIDSGAR